MKQKTALFFRPGDLEPQLEIPLADTIPPKTPSPETLAEAEARRIETLTSNNIFGFAFQQSQDEKAYLVLDRLPHVAGALRTGSRGYLAYSGSVFERWQSENVEPRVVCTSCWCTQLSQRPAGCRAWRD